MVGPDEEEDGTPSVVRARFALNEVLEAFESGEVRRVNFDDDTSSLDAPSAIRVALMALDTSDDIKCTLDNKPPAETRVRPEGPDGALIRRCEHDPSHCWSFNGNRRRCP